MTFSKPVEFTPSQPQAKTTAKVSLVHEKTDGDKSVLLGGADASVVESISSSALSYLKGLNGNPPERIKTGLTDYASSSLKNYNVSASAVTNFVNPSIKAHAWKEDFTATPKNSAANLSPIKGTVTFMVGDTSYYYFSVYSLDYNWQPNQQTWQKVLDSLKIDQ